MSFDDWVSDHARLSSTPHSGVRMDDKMAFFHQLSTLISSGTPLQIGRASCRERV